MFSKIMEKLKILKGFYKIDSNAVSRQIFPYSDWRREFTTLPRSLAKNDVMQVLEACHERNVKPFDQINGNHDSVGVGLRVDMSRGLTIDAKYCIETMNCMGVTPWVLFSLASAGDMAYTREGEYILDPRAVEFLLYIRNAFFLQLRFPG